MDDTALIIEQCDDRVRKARELVERSNYLWRNVRKRFTERYAWGELDIVVRRAVPDEAKYGFLIRAQVLCALKDEIAQIKPATVADDDGSGEKVETASDGVDIGTGLDVERQRQSAFQARYYRTVSAWRFRLFDAAMSIMTEPGSDPLSEGWQLGYGPINACLSG